MSSLVPPASFDVNPLGKQLAKDRTECYFSAIGAPEPRTKFAGCAPRSGRMYAGCASWHGHHVPAEPHVYLNSSNTERDAATVNTQVSVEQG